MARRKRAARPRCVLDSGGLSALARGSERARVWLRWLVEQDGLICVPTPVLAETVTGESGRDAELNRILRVLERSALVLSAPNEDTARRAGALRHRARGDDGVDALVAAAAIGDGTPCVLLTSDPDDMAQLLVAERGVVIEPV